MKTSAGSWASTGTFYNWRKKYSGMEASQLKELKELQDENAKHRHMYADLALQNTMLKDVLEKRWPPLRW